ncbi:MAG: hypothetical protein ACEQSA_06435 [Weeksellaceae bacterium]
MTVNNLETTKHRYRTIPKVFFARVYQNQIQSSKRRKQPLPAYTCSELIDWLKLQPNLTQLWEDFQKSDHDRCYAPSIDRLDDSLPYSLTNIRLTTWHQNLKKATKHMREGLLNHGKTRAKPLQQFTLDGQLVATYQSSHEAMEITGYNAQNLRACANGKLMTAYGHLWRHK